MLAVYGIKMLITPRWLTWSNAERLTLPFSPRRKRACGTERVQQQNNNAGSTQEKGPHLNIKVAVAIAMAVTLADSPPSSHSSPLLPFAGDTFCCGSFVADHPQVLFFFFLFTYVLENSGIWFLEKINLGFNLILWYERVLSYSF